MQRALHREPERRYASVEHLSEDLRRYLEHLPVEARPDVWGYRTSKFLRRNPLAALLAGLLVLSSVGYGFFASIQAERVNRERDRSERALSLLVDLFRGADPNTRTGSAKPTVEEVLDLGARQLLLRVEGEPEVEAHLASLLQSYGVSILEREPARGAAMLREALAMRQKFRTTIGSPKSKASSQ